jgi:hypothetical protein
MTKKMRAISLLLTFLLALCLAACGQASAPSKTPASSDSTAPVAVYSESQPESEPGSQPEPTAPVAEEVKGVAIPAFAVMINGVEINQDIMAAHPMYSVQAVSVNSSGTESHTAYVGFAMKDVLDAAKLTEDYVWVQAVADDGYAVTLTGGVVMEDTTLLAISKDGSPFVAAPWFAPCSSVTTGDYLKSTVSILVNTTEDAPNIEHASPADGGSEPTGGELPEILDRTDKVELAPFSFLVNGTAATNETLAGLSIYKITATTVNSNGETVQADYTGYRLADVLKAVGADGKATVKAVANDGFESVLTAEMILSDHTLVAIEKDKELGEDGTVWLAPCAQTASGSYSKLVTEIIAE